MTPSLSLWFDDPARIGLFSFDTVTQTVAINTITTEVRRYRLGAVFPFSGPAGQVGDESPQR